MNIFAQNAYTALNYFVLSFCLAFHPSQVYRYILLSVQRWRSVGLLVAFSRNLETEVKVVKHILNYPIILSKQIHG